MKSKLQISLIFSFLTFFILIVFCNVYKIQTYNYAYLNEFNKVQVLQLAKTEKKNIDIYKNKKILLKFNNSTFETTIAFYEEDANNYYLYLDKYLSNQNKAKKVLIYDQKIKLGNYIFKNLF